LRVKRGYLASGILAIVMVVGYLGLMPLLQSLAAEPAWPDSPGASSVPVSAPFSMGPVQTQAVANSVPTPIKQKAHHRHTHRNSTPATVHPSRPTTSGKPAPRPAFQLPGTLSGGDSQPTDNGASQSSGG
jgi:hypothetical protein